MVYFGTQEFTVTLHRYEASGRLVNRELQWMWKEAVLARFGFPSQRLLRRNENDRRKPHNRQYQAEI